MHCLEFDGIPFDIEAILHKTPTESHQSPQDFALCAGFARKFR